MPRFAIAFTQTSGGILHKVVELDSKEAALRFFFHNYIAEGYSKDEEGYVYFKEDFDDIQAPSGSIIEI